MAGYKRRHSRFSRLWQRAVELAARLVWGKPVQDDMVERYRRVEGMV